MGTRFDVTTSGATKGINRIWETMFKFIFTNMAQNKP